MKQKFTVLFDLDGTLVDTAPDLMCAHNHVMKKFGFPTKSTMEIRSLIGKGAATMIGRSIWGQAKKEFSKIDDEKVYYVVIINMILIIILGNIDSSSIGGYSIGYELLPINGLLNFIGLYLIRK